MKVEFIRDYRGKPTRERFFETGEEWECGEHTGAVLISVGAAKQVGKKAAPKKKAPAKKKTPAKSKAKK